MNTEEIKKSKEKIRELNERIRELNERIKIRIDTTNELKSHQEMLIDWVKWLEKKERGWK